MVEETQENIVQSETPVAQVAGVTSTPVVEETGGSKWAGMSKIDPENSVDPAENNNSSETDVAPVSKWAGMGDSAEAAGYQDPTIIRDKEVDIDLEDYTSYLGNDIYNPVGGIEALNKSRAINQSWYAQAGNMLGQAVVGEILGGSIEGLGYVLDVAGWADIAKGEEGEWGNWLSDLGKDLREGGQEAMPIYQINEGEFDMADSGWWFSNAVSVASSLSMLIPATGTVKALSFLGKGASRALSAIGKVDDIAANMGKRAKWMSNGVSQAVVSRHIENHMEASGTFESTKSEFLNSIDPTTGLKFTEKDASKYAADAAASNYKLGWAMIMQDIPQYLAIGKVFNPRTMKMESALKKAATKGKNVKIKPWQSKAMTGAKAGGVTFLSEGAEESYQYYIAERGSLKAKLDAGLINEDEYEEELSATIGDTEMMTSAFWGGLGGNIFQAVGPKTQSLFKSKTTRESEANWAKMQTDFLEKRGKSYEAMQKELAIADQMGDPTRRKQIINEMMIGMSLEALTVDKFEQHLESLASLAEMSKEEQEAYKKEQGIELDIELFKEYVPAAIEIANKTRKSFLKHMDKHDTNVSVLMANNDIHIEQFQKRIEDLGKEQAEMSDAFAGTSQMSAYKTEIPRKKSLIKAYQRANEIHRANLSGKATKQKKAAVEAAIKSNEEYIASLESELSNDYKTKEDIHPETRMHNRRHKAGHQTMIDEQFSKEVEKILLEDGISLRQADTAHMGSDAYKKERNLKVTEAKVAMITTVEDADAVKKNIDNNADLTAKEKTDLKAKVEKKKKAILKKKKEQELKAAQEKHDKLRAEEAAKKQEENPENLVAENVAPIDDQVEDEFFEEDSDHVEPVLEKSDAVVDASAEVNKEVKLLDTVASESYDEWVNNTKSKTDQEVDFEISDYTGENKNILEAIRLFNSGVVNDFVYEYLPIKVLIGGNPDVFTFLPTLTQNIALNAKAFNMWNTIDLPQRKIIIDLIKSGKPAKSTIGKTTGGDLIMDPSEDGVPASNVITDLEQNQGKGIGDLDIAITNATGDLVDNRTRDLVKGYAGKKYMVTGVTDEGGNNIPYKGGVFLMVKKADGKTFPLRLNLSRHSIYQADALSEVMSLVMLGKVKLENSLEDLPADLVAYMKENLPAEMAVVEDGSIKDFLNILGYVSENTQGKTSELMFSPDFKSILFGNGKVMNEANLATAKEELMDFLQTKKNVQFNSTLFASSPKYRAWVVNSGVISTNATTKGPIFRRSDNRPTKVFVKPILGDKPKPSVKRKAKASKDIPAQAERKDKSKRAGISKGEQGIPGFTGYYYNEKGGVVAVNARTKKEVQSKLDAKYSSEDISVKVTSNTSEKNADANKKDRLKRSKSSVEKSTMGLPGYEGVYFGKDGKTLTTNLPTKKAVNEWIDKKFASEVEVAPVAAEPIVSATISELETIGFTYPFGKTDKSPAYYEGHPNYKITIDGKKVTTFPWAESTSEANISDNSQKVTSGAAVQDTKGTTYTFKTAAEARLKAKQLAATEQSSEIEQLKKEIAEMENMPISNIPNQAGPGERFQNDPVYDKQLKAKKQRIKELTGPFGKKESLAKSLGFSGWKHVLNSLNKQEGKTKGTKITKKRFESLTENEIKNIAANSASALGQPTQQVSAETFSKVEGNYTLEQKTLKGGIVNQIITNNENGSEIIKVTKPDGSVKFFATGKFDGVPGSMNGLATSQKEIDAVLGQLGVEVKGFLNTTVVAPAIEASISDLEKRDKVEESVEKKVDATNNLRKRRRKNSTKNKAEKKSLKDLQGLDLFSTFANENASSIDSMNTISDVNPGKDKGTINKKCE